jgi:hypothetical protein
VVGTQDELIMSPRRETKATENSIALDARVLYVRLCTRSVSLDAEDVKDRGPDFSLFLVTSLSIRMELCFSSSLGFFLQPIFIFARIRDLQLLTAVTIITGVISIKSENAYMVRQRRGNNVRRD